MSAFYREKVLSVRHWTDTLFSFTATRNTGFRFQNGQFAMIGLEVEGRPLMRAYSMASANHEEELEFFSIKVADGPLTSRLQKIREGDTILVGRKATGTLIADNLIPGRAPAAAVDRHRACAVREPDQGSGRLRKIREHRPGPWLPAGLRTRLWRGAGGETARRRIVRAAARREARVLSDRHPRTVPQPRPHHRSDHLGTAVQRYRPAAARYRRRPDHDVRQPRRCWKNCARCSRAAALPKAATASRAIS